MLLVWENFLEDLTRSRSRRSNKELTTWSDLVLPKKWLGNSEILFKPMKETHLFVTGPYWRSWNFSEFWLLNCPFFQKCDLTLAGPNHHSSQKTSCWWNWSGVFITQKGVVIDRSWNAFHSLFQISLNCHDSTK